MILAIVDLEKEKTMSNLERLKKQKQEMIQRHQRERQGLEDQILRAKERIKREKEVEKQKEQQVKQNNLMSAEAAYSDFVKNSMPITEINKVLDELLN